jgi:hypothetical protein
MSKEWTFMRGCQECGSVVRWVSESPDWRTDEFGRFTICPVCDNRLYLKEGKVPTSEDLRAWISGFLGAGTDLSRAMADTRPRERRPDIEDAREAWDALVREWNRGSLTPPVDVRPGDPRISRE